MPEYTKEENLLFKSFNNLLFLTEQANKKLDNLNSRVDKLDKKLDNLNNDLLDYRKRIINLEENVMHLNANINSKPNKKYIPNIVIIGGILLAAVAIVMLL